MAIGQRQQRRMSIVMKVLYTPETFSHFLLLGVQRVRKWQQKKGEEAAIGLLPVVLAAVNE